MGWVRGAGYPAARHPGHEIWKLADPIGDAEGTARVSLVRTTLQYARKCFELYELFREAAREWLPRKEDRLGALFDM